MQDRFNFWIAFLYTLAAISGAAGGCMIVAHQVLRGRSVTRMFIMAYAFIGLIMGLAGIAALTLLGIDLSFEYVLLAGLVFGAAGSSALAGANLSARFIMSRLGIEVDISVRRIDKYGQSEERRCE